MRKMSGSGGQQNMHSLRKAIRVMFRQLAIPPSSLYVLVRAVTPAYKTMRECATCRRYAPWFLHVLALCVHEPVCTTM